MRTGTIRLSLALLAMAAASPAAFAQAPAAMHGMDMPAKDTPAANRQEMMAAMERMNQTMMAPSAMTGDPDRDFVAMMTPHHQGAIDMARIYLREGRDPAIRRMAQTIITDQEREIRAFRAWQLKHPAPSR